MKYKDLLSKRERTALTLLINELVVNVPILDRFKRNHLPHLSRQIRQEMIDLDTNSQRRAHEGMQRIFSSYKDIQAKKYTELELNTFLQHMSACATLLTDKIFLTGFTDAYACPHPIYEQYRYDHWGFTPKLADSPRLGEQEFWAFAAIRKNCFGTVLGLGAYLGLRGLKFDLGITADHPYIVAYIEKKMYLAGTGGVKKLHGTLEQKKGYKIYVPVPEDDIPHKVIIICDFDRGMLYEILENMELLRRISLGEDVTRLPDTFESGRNLATQHATTLQLANWKQIQAKLFPEITRSIRENIFFWQRELDEMIPVRKAHHAENIFFRAAQEAQKKTSCRNSNFSEAQKNLIEEFRSCAHSVMDFLRNGTAFEKNIALNTCAYFATVREHLETQTSEIQELCHKLIEKKLFETP